MEGHLAGVGEKKQQGGGGDHQIWGWEGPKASKGKKWQTTRKPVEKKLKLTLAKKKQNTP